MLSLRVFFGWLFFYRDAGIFNFNLNKHKMAKQKQLTKDQLLAQLKGLRLQDLIDVAKETAALIANQEKEAEETLSLIRGK